MTLYFNWDNLIFKKISSSPIPLVVEVCGSEFVIKSVCSYKSNALPYQLKSLSYLKQINVRIHKLGSNITERKPSPVVNSSDPMLIY